MIEKMIRGLNYEGIGLFQSLLLSGWSPKQCLYYVWSGKKDFKKNDYISQIDEPSCPRYWWLVAFINYFSDLKMAEVFLNSNNQDIENIFYEVGEQMALKYA